jgi:hypothetical protein
MTAKATDLLQTWANDYQFDKDHPEYLGYLNVCASDITDPNALSAWEFICNYPLTFETICLQQFGLYVKHPGITYHETIFYKK